MRRHLLNFLLLLPALSFALPEDQMQAMHIVAASSHFNYKTGINSYEGDVKIDQGTTHLTADRLITKNDAHHKMEEATAYGIKNPAIYTTTPKIGDDLLRAKANMIKFYPQQSLVHLEGNVVITQAESSFQGPVIIYNMKNQIVTAPALKNGRATILIQPKHLKT